MPKPGRITTGGREGSADDERRNEGGKRAGGTEQKARERAGDGGTVPEKAGWRAGCTVPVKHLIHVLKSERSNRTTTQKGRMDLIMGKFQRGATVPKFLAIVFPWKSSKRGSSLFFHRAFISPYFLSRRRQVKTISSVRPAVETGVALVSNKFCSCFSAAPSPRTAH